MSYNPFCYTLVLTAREYEAVMELISQNETKYIKELRAEGYTTKYINKAIQKLKTSRAV